MVKKRLFFLVLLLVASTLVASQDAADNGNQVQEVVPAAIESSPLPVAVGDIAPELLPVEYQPEISLVTDTPQVISGGPGFQDAVPLEFVPTNAPLDNPDPAPAPAPAPEPENNDDIVVVKKTRKRKRVKTTTEGPYVSCENLPDIIQIKADQFKDIPEGYTADQCVFSIVNEQCEWNFNCEGTVTEAPILIETTVEPEESDSDEDESVEECEPKKKIKFENCFLKIRGLIKKKKPKRCD